jgi:hypothetical protein
MSRGAQVRNPRVLTADEAIAQSDMTIDEKIAAWERLLGDSPDAEIVETFVVHAAPTECACDDCWECDMRDFRRRADARRAA